MCPTTTGTSLSFLLTVQVIAYESIFVASSLSSFLASWCFTHTRILPNCFSMYLPFRGSYISSERYFYFWRNYLVPTSLVNCRNLECSFSLNFPLFCIALEKAIWKFFAAIILCSIIVNHEQEQGEKCWSWIISSGKKLHLNVVKGLIKTMKLHRVFNWQAEKCNALLLNLKV